MIERISHVSSLCLSSTPLPYVSSMPLLPMSFPPCVSPTSLSLICLPLPYSSPRRDNGETSREERGIRDKGERGIREFLSLVVHFNEISENQLDFVSKLDMNCLVKVTLDLYSVWPYIQ